MLDPTPVTFSNLSNGYTVRSPFWVEFGIRGMGVMPAGNKMDKTGHHHMLIDTRLPSDVFVPLPFSDTYRHFGKGQTGTALDLPVGRHTLRLLFADHDHRPYFVFSPEITITVSGRRDELPAPRINADQFDDTCRAWYQDEMTTPLSSTVKSAYLKNIRGGESVESPVLVKFGVVGYGVAPARSLVKDAGYFVLNVAKKNVPISKVSLENGETETILDLLPGEHSFEIEFVSTDGKRLLHDQLPITVVKGRDKGPDEKKETGPRALQSTYKPSRP
ncbi:DUF4399 domain-containing protein [Propionivibrio sp.]|uniref:DUF4399 domain-containing protein n=1 Tax=Propionivibrio sp. TaxID=2212460 RepID=UPI00261C45C8|nr:DUF4399 domain-containing protein [Propionivibrio sp.]